MPVNHSPGMQRNLKVLHVASGLRPSAGGQTTGVLGLTRTIHRRGLNTALFTTTCSHEEFPKNLGAPARAFRISFPHRWHYSPQIKNALQETIPTVDLVHLHDVFLYPELTAARIATRHHVPYVVTPHGELSRWALGHGIIQKEIMLKWRSRRLLEMAGAIHAVSRNEASDIEALGIKTPIEVIPYGIHLDEFSSMPPQNELRQTYPELKDQQCILFLGRIHPVKGLDVLARVFGRIRTSRDNVWLLIVGPDEIGYKRKVKAMLAREGALDRVIFAGFLSGRCKQVAISGSDVFILPSYSEGLPIAALESMACGLPVIVSKQCGLSEVTVRGAGFEVEIEHTQLEEAIKRLLDDSALRASMGSNARKFVQETFTWDKACDKVLELYGRLGAGVHQGENVEWHTKR